MAILSGKTLILARSTILWTVGYLFLTNPQAYAEHPMILLISKSMDMEFVETRDNPLAGLVGLLLIIMGCSDLAVLGLPNYMVFFEGSVPIRLTIYFVSVAYSLIVPTPFLSNTVVFTISFFDVILSFWIFVAIREERNEFRKQGLQALYGTVAENEAEKMSEN